MKREILCSMGFEDAIVFDGPSFDDAIVGVTDDGRVVYDYEAMIRQFSVEANVEDHEAMEFIEYNTIRALEYMGEKAPIIMRRLAE